MSDAQESDRLDGQRHPRETTTLIGQAPAEAAMLQAYRSGRLPHAWLIGGPEGIGKATLAWRLARFVLANPDPNSPAVLAAADLSVPATHRASIQVAAGGIGDVASLRRAWNEKTSRFYTEIRVDEVRKASALFQQAARAGGYRVAIIDAADDLNRASANALLKLIEEPPPLSLFLLVAHRPAQLLPTLRSRCRHLPLRPLDPAALTAVLGTLDLPVAAQDAERLRAAAERGGGSVGGALRWLDGDRLAVGRETEAVLQRLPEIDWAALHRMADRIGNDQADFDLMLGAVLDWLRARVDAVGVASPSRRRLAPLTEVWDKIRGSARDAESLNLDKRAALLSIFADLAQATRSP